MGPSVSGSARHSAWSDAYSWSFLRTDSANLNSSFLCFQLRTVISECWMNMRLHCASIVRVFSSVDSERRLRFFVQHCILAFARSIRTLALWLHIMDMSWCVRAAGCSVFFLSPLGHIVRSMGRSGLINCCTSLNFVVVYSICESESQMENLPFDWVEVFRGVFFAHARGRRISSYRTTG